ncbi:hypothetical protein TNCV_1635161 [Trichonephila clavipes]|nr:hypothetical protein TNCV_1635161 [Trichonephila clavipes]
MQPKPSSLRAQAQLMRTETCGLLRIREREKAKRRNDKGARAGVTDFIRVVEDLDGTVESTYTIAKLKTKIEKSSTFESDPDFVKTLIKNCIDERVSRNEREVTLEKQKIELAKLQLAQLEKEIELQTAKNEALSLNPAAKVEENYPQNLERENKNCYICGDSSHYARDCFKLKESNGHIHNRINVNTLKVESEKQNSDEFAQLQYVSIFVENQPVTALIDSGCQIPVLNSSLIRVQKPSEEIIILSSCFGEQRMVEVKPINHSLNQHSRSKCSNGNITDLDRRNYYTSQCIL